MVRLLSAEKTRWSPHAAARRGTSLVELMVALTLLAVGACALAGSARIVTRLFASGRAWSSAGVLAESTLERMRAGPCPPSTGTVSTGAVDERWSSAGAGGSAVELRDDVSVTTSTGLQSRTILTARQCAP